MCIPDSLTIFAKIARIVSGSEGAIEKKFFFFFSVHMYLPEQLPEREQNFPPMEKIFPLGICGRVLMHTKNHSFHAKCMS